MKKQDQFYFDNFVECTDCALRAARLLQDTMKKDKGRHGQDA